MYDFAIIGGGIVGLSTALSLIEQYPTARILLVEKESHWAAHQTGRNSGVIHSGIYYKPGSYKARFAKAGNQSMVQFCQEHGIEHDICGKVIVATNENELSLLDQLYERGLQNGLQLEKWNPDQLKEREPYVQGLAAIKVPSAGIVNYEQVCLTIVSQLQKEGHDLQLNTRVDNIVEEADQQVILETNRGTFQSKFLINCTGLHSDRLTKRSGVKTDLKIVPFRGEYYKLKPEKEYLVNHLIYPVPNPAFPFLGVHFTRMMDGGIEAGPNAVLSLKREGYKKTDVNMRDLAETFSYPGFWRLARKYWKVGMGEMVRSVSKAAFVRSLQQLIPDIKAEDLEPGPAGVRAQALLSNGKLVDDFHIMRGKSSIHVCNAPSPAATAALEIGAEIARMASDSLPAEPTRADSFLATSSSTDEQKLVK